MLSATRCTEPGQNRPLFDVDCYHLWTWGEAMSRAWKLRILRWHKPHHLACCKEPWKLHWSLALCHWTPLYLEDMERYYCRCRLCLWKGPEHPSREVLDTVFFILRHFPESFPVWGFQEMPGTQCIDCITVFSCSLFIGSTVSTNLLRKKIALPITSNRHKSLFITEIERKRVKLNQLLTHDIFHWLFIT